MRAPGKIVSMVASACAAGAITLAARSGPAKQAPARLVAPPPDTRVEQVVDTLHGVRIPDPYRWLERQDDPATRRWIDAQNAHAEDVVGRTAVRARLEARLRGLMDVPSIDAPQVGGAFEYYTMRRRGDEVPILFRRRVAAGGAPGDGRDEVVIDPHAFSADRTTRIELLAVEADGKRVIYSVRDGGQDEIEVRVRDVATGCDLDDRLPSALYSAVSFDPDGAGFFYSRRSRSAGARVYFHRWGQPSASDAVVFGRGYGPETFVTMSPAAGGRHRIFVAQYGWTREDVYVADMKRGGAIQPIVVGADAHFSPRIVDEDLWMRTDLGAANGRIVAVSLDHADRDRWRTIVPECEDVIDDYAVIADRVYVSYMHEVSSRIRVFKKDGTPDGEIAVPEFHTASIVGAGPGQALLTLESFTTPKTTWLMDLRTGARTPHGSRTPPPWKPDDVVVGQEWAVSKDGTRVPLFLVHGRGFVRDGRGAVLLHGYGGFNAATRPRFDPAAIAWIEAGGAYAVANMRGGNEFGEAWHQAGMLSNKQHVFDDFIAVAEWLVSNRYTKPERLAISGVSNGGLLVGAALTQRPDLFRAVLCRFPDVDILRFFEFTATNNMPALPEYGNASIRGHFDAIRKYSPYQNVRNGTPYPAVMIVSGDLDTRVPPLAARKFTARLQAATTSGRPVILHYRPKAGHARGNGLPFSVGVADAAMELAFLMAQTGLAHEGSPDGVAERN